MHRIMSLIWFNCLIILSIYLFSKQVNASLPIFGDNYDVNLDEAVSNLNGTFDQFVLEKREDIPFSDMIDGLHYYMGKPFTRVGKVIYLDGHRGSKLESALASFSIELDLCYAYTRETYAKIFYNDNNILTVQKYDLTHCHGNLFESTLIDVAGYSISSFFRTTTGIMVTSSDKLPSFVSFEATSTMVPNMMIRYYYTDAFHHITALEGYPKPNFPSYRGEILIRDGQRVDHIFRMKDQNFYKQMASLRYDIWMMEYHLSPNGCQKIGNHYYKDEMDTSIRYGFYTTLTYYACKNDLCPHTVEGMCVSSVVDYNSKLYPAAVSRFYGQTATMPDGNHYVHVDLNGRFMYHPLTIESSIDDFIVTRTSFDFYGISTTATASYAIAQAKPECIDRYDNYFEINACRYAGSKYAKRTIRDNRVVDEFYHTDNYHCGGSPLSTEVLLVKDECYVTRFEEVPKTHVVFTSTNMLASPTISYVPAQQTQSVSILNSAFAVPTQISKEQYNNPEGFGLRVNYAYIKKAIVENDNNLVGYDFSFGNMDVVAVYRTCTPLYNRYRISYRWGGNQIFLFDCETSACDISKSCRRYLTFQFTTEYRNIDSFEYDAQVYKDHNSVTVRNYNAHRVYTDFYIPETLRNAISPIPTYTYVPREFPTTIDILPVFPVVTDQACTSIIANNEFSHILLPGSTCIKDDEYGYATYNVVGTNILKATAYPTNDAFCTGQGTLVEGVLECSTASSFTISTSTFEIIAVPTMTNFPYVNDFDTALELVEVWYHGSAFADKISDAFSNVLVGFKSLISRILTFPNNKIFARFALQPAYFYPVHIECHHLGQSNYLRTVRHYIDWWHKAHGYLCKTDKCDIYDSEDCSRLAYAKYINADIISIFQEKPTVEDKGIIAHKRDYMEGDVHLHVATFNARSVFARQDLFDSIPEAEIRSYSVSEYNQSPVYLEYSVPENTCENQYPFEYSYKLLDNCYLNSNTRYVKHVAGEGVVSTLHYNSRDVGCATPTSTEIVTVPPCFETSKVTGTPIKRYSVNANSVFNLPIIETPSTTVNSEVKTDALPTSFFNGLDSVSDSIQGVGNYLSTGNIAANQYDLFGSVVYDYFIPSFTRTPIANCNAVNGGYIKTVNMKDNHLGLFFCTRNSCPVEDVKSCTLIKTFPYYNQALTFNVDSNDKFRFFSSNNQYAVRSSLFSPNSVTGDNNALSALASLDTFVEYKYYVKESVGVDTYWQLEPKDTSCAISNDFYTFRVLLLSCYRDLSGFSMISNVESRDNYYRGVVYHYDINDPSCGDNVLSSDYTTFTTEQECFRTEIKSVTQTKFALTSTIADIATPTIQNPAARDLQAQLIGGIQNINSYIAPTYGSGFIEKFFSFGVNKIYNPDNNNVLAYDVKILTEHSREVFNTCTKVSDFYFLSVYNSTSTNAIDTFKCISNNCPLDYLQDCSFQYSTDVNDNPLSGLNDRIQNIDSHIVLNGINKIGIESQFYVNSLENDEEYGIIQNFPSRTMYNYYATTQITEHTYAVLINQGNSACDIFDSSRVITNNTVNLFASHYILLETCFKSNSYSYVKNLSGENGISLFAYHSTDINCNGPSTLAKVVSYYSGEGICYETSIATLTATQVILTSTTAPIPAPTAVITVAANENEAALNVFSELSLKDLYARDYHEIFSGYISNSNVVHRAITDPTTNEILGLDYIFPIVVRYWLAEGCVNDEVATIKRRDTRAPIKRDEIYEGIYYTTVFDKYNRNQILSYQCSTSVCDIASDDCAQYSNTTVTSNINDIDFSIGNPNEVFIGSNNQIAIQDFFGIGNIFYGTASELDVISTSTVATKTVTETEVISVIETVSVDITETEMTTYTSTTIFTDYVTESSTSANVEYTTVYIVNTITIDESVTEVSTYVTDVTVTYVDYETEIITQTETLGLTIDVDIITTVVTEYAEVTESIYETYTTTVNIIETSTSTSDPNLIIETVHSTVINSIQTTTTEHESVVVTESAYHTHTTTHSTLMEEVVTTTVTPETTPSSTPCNDREHKWFNHYHHKHCHNHTNIPYCGPQKMHWKNAPKNYGKFNLKSHYKAPRRQKGRKPIPPPQPPKCLPDKDHEYYMDLYMEGIKNAQILYKRAIEKSIEALKAQANVLIEIAKAKLLESQIKSKLEEIATKTSSTKGSLLDAIKNKVSSEVNKISSSISVANNIRTAWKAIETIAKREEESNLNQAQLRFDTAGINLFNAFFK